LLAEALVSAIDPASWRASTPHHGTIGIVNETRLVVRANASRQAEVAQLLQVYRRQADLAVTLEAKLYEVDQVFYTRLINAPYVSREESERRATGKPEPKNSLFKLLEKQKLVLAGEKRTIENGVEVTLLSRFKAVGYLPPPEHKKPPAVLEGFSFEARVQVSPDRRWVGLQIKEKLTEVEEIKKLEVFASSVGGRVKEVPAELPILREITHAQDADVPDGGAHLLAVHVRPRALQAKNRWWVLHISPRIIIAEEEQIILQGYVKDDLPLLIADILNNPRLKTAREFAGTPGDKRFALVDSNVWTWPKELRRSVSGYQLTPMQREGKRLLGIRVDRFQWSEKEDTLLFSVTLVNAGGSANGEAVGGCTLHYSVRGTDKSRTIKLTDGTGQ
jgi:hypothetical protein